MLPLNTFYKLSISIGNSIAICKNTYVYYFHKLFLYNLLLLAVVFSIAFPFSISIADEQQNLEKPPVNNPEPEHKTTVLSGKILPKLTAQPYLPFISVIEQILVEPGQAVQKGQPIISYKLNAEALRALQREILFGANTEKLKSQILDAKQNLSTELIEHDKINELVKSNLAADRALIDIKKSIAHQRNKISLLQTTLNKETQNFEIRLSELSGYFGVNITTIDSLPEILYLKSLVSGNILSIASNLYVGTQVEAQFVPMQIANLDTMIIIVQVYETELNTIKVGDKAIVQIPSLQDKEFEAIVSRVSWLSTDLAVANPSFFTIELEIPNPNLELRPGFKAIVHFK